MYRNYVTRFQYSVGHGSSPLLPADPGTTGRGSSLGAFRFLGFLLTKFAEN